MNVKAVVTAVMVSALATNAHAQDIRDQWNIQISKAELVFPGASPHEVANGIKEALSPALPQLPSSHEPIIGDLGHGSHLPGESGLKLHRI